MFPFITRVYLALLLVFGFSSSVFGGTFSVTNLNDVSPGSIGAAILDANASPGLDTIVFSVAGVINLNGQLPAVEDAVFIDGGSAPGYVACGAPVVALNFVGGGGAHGLLILSGGAGSTVKALNIRGFTAAGISSEFSSNITVQSCYIGTDLSGTVPMGNNLGIFLLGSPDCVIGGDACERNVVCASNANGIAMELGSHRAVVAGNYVGLGADGVTLMGNGLEGIYAFDSDWLEIGLAGVDEGNVVVGSAAQGIHINGSGSGASNSFIRNNWVGTNGSDSTVYGNALNGVFIEGGKTSVSIGGSGPLEVNRIAYNGLNGVQVDSLSNFISILENSIFCNADSGIYLYFANDLIPVLPNLSSGANSVSGTGGTPGNFVGVFRNLTVVNGDSTLCDCEGEDYLGTTVVDGQGNWTLVHNLGLTPAEQGSVTATQTDLLGNTSQFTQSCTGATSVGLEDASNSDLVSVSPNPSGGVFHLRVREGIESGFVQVFDVMGRRVFADAMDGTDLVLDGGSWNNGVYLVRVETVEGVGAVRLWKR